MAEFAAASSAAGLVSLGLQVCSGLIKYCSAWKSYDKDHLTLLAPVKGLTSVLEVLHQVLRSSDLANRPSFQIVHDNIIISASAINELELWARKLWLDSSTATSAISKQIKRARYPLRKNEMSSLNSTLGDLQSNLGLAMQVAQRYVNMQTQVKVWELLTPPVFPSEQMSYLISVNRSQHHQALGQFGSISI